MIPLLTYYTVAGLLALAGLYLLTHLAGHWLNLANRLRQVIHQAGLDAIQLYSSWANACLDLEARQAKLDYYREVAHIRLDDHRRRLMLPTGAEGKPPCTSK